MQGTFSLPAFLEQELKVLEAEAEQNLKELAEERQKLSADLHMSLTEALRNQLK